MAIWLIFLWYTAKYTQDLKQFLCANTQIKRSPYLSCSHLHLLIFLPNKEDRQITRAQKYMQGISPGICIVLSNQFSKLYGKEQKWEELSKTAVSYGVVVSNMCIAFEKSTTLQHTGN